MAVSAAPGACSVEHGNWGGCERFSRRLRARLAAGLSAASLAFWAGSVRAAPSGSATVSSGADLTPSSEGSPAAAGEAAGQVGGAEAVPAAVTPPRVLAAAVLYPAGAVGSAVVLLELVIERDGSVQSVEVVSGPEPFASEASRASSTWRFEPATRGGQAVPARIRFEVRYTPPSQAEPPSIAPTPAQAVLPALSAPLVQVTEVQVLGDIAPGALALSQAEVRVLPGAFGDPFRAVSVLPGVGQLVTGLPVFFVRGAPPGNLGYTIDGIRVPLLFHAFLGPAVIHPKMIERVELHPGAYPASLGRYAGGMVSADLSEPQGELNGEWSARLIDAGAFVDVPFAGGRGNVMLAGRYSYTALLLSLFSDLELQYWDYQALASYDLTSRDRVSVFAFGAYDFAATPPDPDEPELAGSGENAVLFHRVDLRYDHRYSETSRLRAAFTLGLEGTRGGQGLVQNGSLAGRLEYRSQLTPDVLLRSGISSSVDRYRLELDPNTENYLDVVALFPSRVDSVIGAHADVVIAASPDVTFTPGIRIDHYVSAGNTAIGVSPRLAASFRVTDDVSIEHAVGIADQPPNFVPGVPGVAVAGLPGGLQRSVQTSSTLRAELPWSTSGSASVFYNGYFRLTDPFSQNQDLELDVDEARVRSLGRAYGLELMLTRRLSDRIGGLLSYTLSRSTRSHERIHTLSGYDRPHVVNLALSYDLGRRWLVSARTIAYSGVPGSRTFGERRIFDQSRARPFFRVDARLEKRFQISQRSWWAVVAELMNASFSREVLRRPCEPDCQDDVVGPLVLPSLGVTGQF
jgi:TonB family protein